MSEAVNTSKFNRLVSGTRKFFREIKGELKKVIWPTPKQLMINSVAVFSICALVGVFIFLWDNIFGFIFKMVFGQ